MTSSQKFSVSLLISVIAFAAFSVLSLSGRFSFIEAKFYQPAVRRPIEQKVNDLAEQEKQYNQILADRFAAFASNESVMSFTQGEPSEKNVKDRTAVCARLIASSPYLTGIRIIDETGRKIHYSTFDSDKKKQVDNKTVYEDYDKIVSQTDEIKFIQLLCPSDSRYKIFNDEERNRVIYSIPFTGKDLKGNTVQKGQAFFYCEPSDFVRYLYSKNALSLNDKESCEYIVTGTTDTGGYIFGLPYRNLELGKKGFDFLVTEICRRLENQSIERSESVFEEKITLKGTYKIVDKVTAAEESIDSEKVNEVSTREMENDETLVTDLSYVIFAKFIKNGTNDSFICFVYDAEIFEMNTGLRVLMLTLLFITIFLLIFLIFNLKHDDMVVIRDRIRRFQLAFITEYINSQNDNPNALPENIANRKAELNSEIRASLGRRGKKHSAEVDALLEKNWSEILASLGVSVVTGIKGPSSAIDSAELRSILEEILGSGKIKIAAESVTVAEEKPAVKTAAKSKTVKKEDELEEVETVEEVADAEEIDELEEVEAVEEIADAEEIDELEEVEAVEEVADSEEVDELEEVETVEEVADAEEADELEEVDAVEEVSDAEEVDELEEVEAVEEVAAAEEADELEEVEAVEEVADAEEIDDLEEVETVEEIADAEEADELEEVEAVEEVAATEEIDELEEVEAVEEVVEAEEVDELEEVETVEEVAYSEEADELEEVEAVEEVADAEEADELEEVEAVEEVADAEEADELEEVEAVEEIADAEEADELEEVETVEEVADAEEADELEEVEAVEEIADAEEADELEEVEAVEEIADAEEADELEEVEAVEEVADAEEAVEKVADAEVFDIQEFDESKEIAPQSEELDYSDLQHEEMGFSSPSPDNNSVIETKDFDENFDVSAMDFSFLDEESVTTDEDSQNQETEEITFHDHDWTKDIQNSIESDSDAENEYNFENNQDTPLENEQQLSSEAVSHTVVNLLDLESDDDLQSQGSIQDSDEKPVAEKTVSIEKEDNIEDAEEIDEVEELELNSSVGFDFSVKTSPVEELKAVDEIEELEETTADEENFENAEDVEELENIQSLEEPSGEKTFMFTTFAANNNNITYLESEIPPAIVENQDGTYCIDGKPDSSELKLDMNFKKLVEAVLK